MELIGDRRGPAAPGPLAARRATGGTLAPDATLDELGVLDGETVRLGPRPRPRPPPCSRPCSTRWPCPRRAAARRPRPGDRATSGRRGRVRRFGGRPCRSGRAAPGRRKPHRLRLAAARRTRWGRQRSPGVALGRPMLPTDARTRRGAGAFIADSPRRGTGPCALARYRSPAAAGWGGLPGPPGAARLLSAAVAAGTAAALAQVAVRTVVPALVGAVVAAVLAAAAAVARLQFDLAVPVSPLPSPLPRSRAGPLLPRGSRCGCPACPGPCVAADARGWSPRTPVRTCCRPPSSPPAPGWPAAELAGLSGGFAVVAAMAAPPAATGGWAGWTGPALAAAVAAVLLLRARGFADAGDRPGAPVGRLGGRSRAGRTRRGRRRSGRSPAGALILIGAAGITIATRAGRRPPARPWPATGRGPRRGRPRRGRGPARPRGGGRVRTGARAVSRAATGGRRGARAARPAPRARCATRPLPAPSGTGRGAAPPRPRRHRTVATLAERLRLPAVHALATGRGQRVAVIDTGVAPHPRLAGRLVGLDDLLARR